MQQWLRPNSSFKPFQEQTPLHTLQGQQAMQWPRNCSATGMSENCPEEGCNLFEEPYFSALLEV